MVILFEFAELTGVYMQLVLASTSPFRRELLERLGLSFETCAPEVDETREAGEKPEALVMRLAARKAEAVAQRFPKALIIGSDQVACLEDRVLGKPGSRDNAMRQLRDSAGKEVLFLTGLCLFNGMSGRRQVICEPFRVRFRELDDERIARYVDAEQPFNCAGGFKSEGLGITLFRGLHGEDPNALIGLPLIRLVDMLAEEGVALP